MLERIIQVAKSEKLEELQAYITPDNHAFQAMLKSYEFTLTPSADGKMIKAAIKFE